MRTSGLPPEGRYLAGAAILCCAVAAASCATSDTRSRLDDIDRADRPNILVIVADEWRAQALGYAGDPNVRTPNIDRLAAQSVNFVNAVSGMPACSPFRASLMTGQRPLTHGVFMNDVQLDVEANTIGKVLTTAGYSTGYIGKWHLDGRGRMSFTPPERRQGFAYWRALECPRDHQSSMYYGDSPVPRRWEGYDPFAQTRDAQAYMKARVDEARAASAAGRAPAPFALFLAWGAPHGPYKSAPEKYKERYRARKLILRDNVPSEGSERIRRNLIGYYAHCTALDDAVGELMETLRSLGIDDDTIVVFTSDHGSLVGSHGARGKLQPYDESLRIPMLIRFPRRLADHARSVGAVMNAEDIMPTLLGLAGIGVPDSVEGLDYTAYMQGGDDPSGGATVVGCAQPFGHWSRNQGGREYRGLVTPRYTYARDLDGPWLLFDNRADPYQLDNLVTDESYDGVVQELDADLRRRLAARGDEFLPGPAYVEKWGYVVDQTGTVPLRD